MVIERKKRSEFNLKVELSIEQQEFIFKGILEGRSVKSLCTELQIPFNWVFDYALKDPEFHKKMQKTREYAAHLTVDDLLHIADDAKTMAEVQRAKVQSENIKWSAGKLMPEIYGERIELNMNHHLDLSSVLLAAENRVLPLLAAKSALVTPPVDVESRLISDSRASFESGEGNDAGENIPEELMDLIWPNGAHLSKKTRQVRAYPKIWTPNIFISPTAGIYIIFFFSRISKNFLKFFAIKPAWRNADRNLLSLKIATI